MAKYYAGIGSREIPRGIVNIMTGISIELENSGYILRSGGAKGADSTFEYGVQNKQIYLPWRGFNGNNSKFYRITPEAMDLARH